MIMAVSCAVLESDKTYYTYYRRTFIIRSKNGTLDLKILLSESMSEQHTRLEVQMLLPGGYTDNITQ